MSKNYDSGCIVIPVSEMNGKPGPTPDQNGRMTGFWDNSDPKLLSGFGSG